MTPRCHSCDCAPAAHPRCWIVMADRRGRRTTSGTALASLLTSMPASRESTRPMDTTASMNPTDWQRPIRRGMTVYGADGAKVGTVTAVGAAYLTVEQGFFVTTDYYAPTSAIAAVGD